MYDIRWQRIWLVIVTVLGISAIPLFLIFRGHTEDLRFSFTDAPCILSRYCHLYCVGCGGTRSVRYLLQGRIVDSILANPMTIYIGLIMIRVWSALLYNCTVGLKRRKMIPPLSEPEIWMILVVSLGFAIVRDILLIFLQIDYLGDLAAFW